MKPLIVITGPTASGKTEMSIEMAQKIGGEIVNADSMQVYKYMDIGTAKPTLEERNKIPHYLIDEVEPTVSYSVAQYVVAARDYIAKVHEKQKTPILVGGTGLYIDSVVNNIQYGEGGVDENYRMHLKKIADEMGNEHIHKMLHGIDPKSAEKIHVSDRKRIIRALEVYHLTGETITEQKEKSRLQKSPYQVEMYAINMDRSKLYDRINKRVDIMIKKGLVEEVERLIKMGVNENMTSMQGIGYKEIMQYLKGEISLDEATDMIKQGTRRYAKRQLTWLRKNSKIQWIWR
jgi:tRNA dimethylallyltransferase